ncbi:sugar phosphate isomerase/epimerase family protein [Paenibacillus sp. sgz302251]|uniref:sugar phosphate isomerase/epimerase family protein n=1 Tax=Paenibacillus sp. sgz302251 TaxID=3414493 RepID=UPI003C7D6E09
MKDRTVKGLKKGIHDVPFISSWMPENFFGYAKAAGFDGVELNVLEETGYLNINGTIREAKRIHAAGTNYGLEIHSLSTNLHNQYILSSGDRNIRDRGQDIALKMIEYAAEIGAKVVQIVPGAITRDTCYSEAYQHAQQSLSRLGAEAKAANIILGVENICNRFLPSPKEFMRFLEEIDHPSVQAYLDIGNAMATGYPEHWIPLMGKRIVNIHVKDYRNSAGEFVSPLAGDVQWPGIMEALRKVDYQGYMMTTPPRYAFCSERLMESCSSDLSAILKL